MIIIYYENKVINNINKHNVYNFGVMRQDHDVDITLQKGV